MRQNTVWRRGLLLAAGLGAGVSAQAQTYTATVTAGKYDYKEVPVSVVVPASSAAGEGGSGEAASCQAEPAGDGTVRLTWIVRDLKQGQSRTYRLTPAKASPGSGVELKQNGGNLDFLVNGTLFTRYDTTTGPTKPYFYPLNGPTGKPVVRRWPMENVPGETTDHPHHRGLWFTHGEMNDVDFWTEGPAKGKTIHTAYEAAESGPVYGRMRAKTDWVTPEGRKIAEDVRDVRVYNVQNGCLMDFAITVKAVGGPLVWGDTKEGTFSIRVADSLRPNLGKGKVGEGRIVNAAGHKDGDTWGKAAAWCDYYGPIDGETVGIAVFDSPSNLRHPTTWHVRDYGLFAVNPFGLHDFDPAKKNDRHAGDLTTPEGQTVTWSYRIFIHKGSTDAAGIPAVWNAYAEPPQAAAGGK